ncbi:MAG: heme lyase CcmF/NrfE family subunit [Deltaproteobacteria bacterium]|nr:heme lyase CcmF/NrfE family subunit [Deltaproteobacteria bacterium]
MNYIVYIGNISIALAIGFCVFGMLLYFLGRKLENDTALAYARASVYANFVLMTLANLAMVHALLNDDFSVSYVAQVGSLETPRWISAISLWSSLAGSILFWGWILSAYSAVCIYFYREREQKIMCWVGITLLFVELFFFVLLALPSNPFIAVSPVPQNGPGPNPLLQNHWLMSIHPPFLYMGYIGFTIPFAFAIAAMIEQDLPGQWIEMTRRWALFAWSFLSMAIVLGGWWSYAVLGWGGYWAWDPVENASFMPWLAGTALVHSMIVQEKRKMLPVWNLILAVLTFLLTLLGTFLTRSGVLDSVHSFTESHVGPYFLIFMTVILATSLSLLLWQAPKFRNPGRVENIFSLEVLFLFNNLLFVSFCFVVFLGTIYPLVVEAVQGKRISIGQPYFNQMTIPIVGMMLLLMGIGLITPWRKTEAKAFVKAAQWPALLALLPLALCFVWGKTHPLVVGMITLASFAFFVMCIEMIQTARLRAQNRKSSCLAEFFRLFPDNPRRYGGFVAHFGALMIIVAVAISSSYAQDRMIILEKGQSASIGDYSLTFREIFGEDTPRRYEVKADVDVTSKGKSLGSLFPQSNYYSGRDEPIGSPAVRSTGVEDLYLTLLSFEKNGSKITLHAILTPAVVWIWIGGIVVMTGGFMALALGRKKKE